MLAHETAAIRGQSQTIQVAQAQYMADFGQFAGNLTQLGPVQSGDAGPEAGELIRQDLEWRGRVNGYDFAVAGRMIGYRVNAAPEVFGSSRALHVTPTSLAIGIRENSYARASHGG